MHSPLPAGHFPPVIFHEIFFFQQSLILRELRQMNIVQRMGKKPLQLGSFLRYEPGPFVRNLLGKAGAAVNPIAAAATPGQVMPGSQSGKKNKVDINCQDDDEGGSQQEAIPLHPRHEWGKIRSEEDHLIEPVTVFVLAVLQHAG